MRPTMDEILTEMAVLMARRSTCSRAAVGAVAAREGRVVSSGYNGAPAGMPHCQHPQYEVGQISSADVERATCTVSVHAEANLVAFSARHGVALDGTVIYTTYTPCVECAKLLINAGVIKVIALRAYRNPAGVDLLRSAGIEVVTT